jgi:hypothetical protein
MRNLYTGESALSSAAIEARHISEPFFVSALRKGGEQEMPNMPENDHPV